MFGRWKKSMFIECMCMHLDDFRSQICHMWPIFIHTLCQEVSSMKKRINRLPFTCICRKTYFYAFSFRKLKIGGKEQSKWVNWSEKWHGPYDTYGVNTEHTLNIYWKAPALTIWKIAIFASLHLHAEHSNARNGPSVDLGVCVDVLTG